MTLLQANDLQRQDAIGKPSISNRLVNRRTFLGLGSAAVLGLGLYSTEFGRHDLEITEHTVNLPNLADSFHGMRLVQISDVHFHEFSEAFYIRDVVKRVNALKPDLVLLTGDFVTEGPLSHAYGRAQAHPCAAILQGLECAHRYAVMGNHDAKVGVPAVIDALVTHDIPVLENQYVPIERDGRRFWLAGSADVTAHMARLELAVPPKTVRGNDPVVLMAHEPDFLDHVAKYGGVNFMVSGHTHGGQVRLPFVGPTVLPPLGQKYVEGFFQRGQTLLYVNRGIGTVGMPVRFMCRPEITVFTLSAG
jgi:predicted MPP superfamily phosphohydrolase